MKNFFKILLLCFIALCFFGCEEDEGADTIAFDYFRDMSGFSNSLYYTKTYSKSPYHGTKEVKTQATATTASSTEIRDYTTTYSEDGRFLSKTGTSMSGEPFSTTTSLENNILKYCDKFNSIFEIDTYNEDLLLTKMEFPSSSSVYTYTYDGFNRTGASSDSYIYTFSYDGDFPLEKTCSYNNGDAYKIVFKNDGEKVISAEYFKKSSNSADYTLSSTTAYTYDSSNNVIEVRTDDTDGDYEVITITWKNGLPAEYRHYNMDNSSESPNESNLERSMSYEWDSKGRCTKMITAQDDWNNDLQDSVFTTYTLEYTYTKH